LRRGIEIAGLPILAPGVLAGLARELEMSKADAARFWAGVLNSVLPYIHQRLSQLSVLPAGSPGSGQPIYWSDVGAALPRAPRPRAADRQGRSGVTLTSEPVFATGCHTRSMARA
jgi:hypothetical protein